MEKKVRVCSKCGHVVNKYTYFCPLCGAETEEQAEGTTVLRETKTAVLEEKGEPAKERPMADKGQTSSPQRRKGARLLASVLLGIVLLAFAAPFLSLLFSREVPAAKSGDELQPDEETAAVQTQEPESTKEEPESESDTRILEDDRYECIVEDITWDGAFDACVEKGGHLVRIDSPEKYWEIARLLEEEGKTDIKFWIGAARKDLDWTYYWVYENRVYGEEVENAGVDEGGYWMEGQPSFFNEEDGTSESRVLMFYDGERGQWVWDDVPSDILYIIKHYAGAIGYICEYKENHIAAP